MGQYKEEKLERAMESVIELEVEKGHLAWSLSDLSRRSGVTRTLIYYYFGNEKKAIFKTAVEYYVDEFFAFKIERADKIRKGEVIELIRRARQRLNRSPHFLQFYALQRSGQGEVKKMFERAERAYFANLEASLPKRKQHLARVLWALIFGLAVQPEVLEKDLALAEKILKKAWG